MLNSLRQLLSSKTTTASHPEEEEAAYPPDFTPEEIAVIEAVKPFTMTSPERMVSLIRAVEYLAANGIAGDMVECGVWRGGSMMIVAKVLSTLGVTDRNLYLYDTYEGMSEPREHVDVSYEGDLAKTMLEVREKTEQDYIWCYSPIEEVKKNVYGTGYPAGKMHFVKGKVEETIPARVPDQIALLRLDTDWYESTYHELEHLFPRLVKGGILIIDDYGHWQGARKATDDYFQKHNVKIFLGRTDYTGRIAVKI
jgi:hypothetical protein